MKHLIPFANFTFINLFHVAGTAIYAPCDCHCCGCDAFRVTVPYVGGKVEVSDLMSEKRAQDLCMRINSILDSYVAQELPE